MILTDNQAKNDTAAQIATLLPCFQLLAHKRSAGIVSLAHVEEMPLAPG